MRIIVNADDLGISDSVNEAIFQGMQRGTVTSSTILANGPAVKAAARSLHQFPQCSFGVHLNLTEFEPVCPDSNRDLRTILDQSNRFNGNSIREVPVGVGMLRAVFREWCHQIESLMRMGIELSHFDAHHHVHTIPQMLPVLWALRKRYKIDRIRISRNVYDPSEHPAQSLLAKKRAYNLVLRRMGFRTTRIFADMVPFIRVYAAHAPAAASAELMTHPGSSSNEESVLLEGGWVGKLPYDVSLISYKSL